LAGGIAATITGGDAFDLTASAFQASTCGRKWTSRQVLSVPTATRSCFSLFGASFLTSASSIAAEACWSIAIASTGIGGVVAADVGGGEEEVESELEVKRAGVTSKMIPFAAHSAIKSPAVARAGLTVIGVGGGAVIWRGESRVGGDA